MKVVKTGNKMIPWIAFSVPNEKQPSVLFNKNKEMFYWRQDTKVTYTADMGKALVFNSKTAAIGARKHLVHTFGAGKIRDWQIFQV